MTIPKLDPRFGKLVALMESTTHEAERASARRKAEAVLTPEAGGFDRGLRILAYEKARAGGVNNMFAGFDEHIEIDKPGHMAQQAAERAEKRRQQDARRSELVAEFGSLEAVLRPCVREKVLLAAVKPWRVVQPGSRGRWTKALAGLGMHDEKKAPPELVDTIEQAIPMPTTYAEAVAEIDYWSRRNDDMELACRDQFLGDYMLDTPALWRWWMVRDLAEHKMALSTLAEVLARMKAYRFSESGTDERIEDAIIRDLEVLAARETGS